MNKPELQRDKERRTLIDTRLVYEGRIVQLKLETYQFDTRKKVAEIVQHPGAVVILPIDPEGRILLVRQWRRAVGKIILELPAGTLEPGEEPIECAKRELQEETGFACEKITPLGGFYSAPGFCSEFLHLFLAEHLYCAPLPPDDDEMIEIIPVTIKEAREMIVKNQIQDAKSIAGILRFLCVSG